MRRVSGGCLIWAILLLGLIPVAYSEIYKWVDRQGKVHFTDNLSAIPPESRDQIEERTSASPSHPPDPGTPGSAPVPQLSVEEPQASTRYTVPLHREGNASLVDVVFNGTLKIRMIVDTGASWTLLPTSAAKQLALHLEKAPVMFISGVTRSKPALVPLTKVMSITVGDATAQDVEVIVYDTSPLPAKARGLLGMTFLDEFQVTIDPIAGHMIMTPLSELSRETLYGGRPEVWWRRKFRYYHSRIKNLEAYLSKWQSPSQSELAKTLRYYQEELAMLELKATLAGIPSRWYYE